MLTSFDRTVHGGARLAVIAFALIAGGCQQHDPVVTNSFLPIDYRDRHPIVITERPRSVDIFIGTGRGGLTAVQRAQVAAFGGAWRREGNGLLAIDIPQNTPNATASQATVREISSVLASTGVPPKAISVRPYRPAAPIEIGPIRLNYPVMRAEAGPCGEWPDDLGPTASPSAVQNNPYWNFGCATQRNLAAAVVEPGDLVQPRPETPPYAARRSTVIDKYRQGQDPTTVYKRVEETRVSQDVQ